MKGGSYYSRHREEIQEKKKLCYIKNRSNILEQKATYYLLHREAIRQKKKVYYDKNRDGILKRKAAYYRSDPMKVNREHPNRNRENSLRYSRSAQGKHKRREYYLNNREKIQVREKDRKMRLRYGVSLDKLNQLLTIQGNKCGICGREFVGKAKPCVDHCHNTEHVRSLLCLQCNFAIGFLKHSPVIAHRAFEYLLKSELLNGKD